MKVNIIVDVKEAGNPQRGYHNYDTMIQFVYETDSTFVKEKEGSIVEAITSAKGSWMWHNIRNTSPGIWTANYGYDSGD